MRSLLLLYYTPSGGQIDTWRLAFAAGGVAFVSARSFGAAVMRARQEGLHPGGEVSGLDIDAWCPPPPEMLYRLLSEGEAAAFEEQWRAESRAARARRDIKPAAPAERSNER